MNSKISIILLCAATAFTSCRIQNDIALPKVAAEFTEFKVDGQNSAKIDSKALTVTVDLSEDVRMNNLSITAVKISEGSRCNDSKIAEGQRIDLSEPYSVVLSNFRKYTWTISATQSVERYVKCENQIGDAAIFPDEHKVSLRVKAKPNSAVDTRSNLVITNMKLGLKGSKIVSTTDMNGNTQAIESFPVTLDCFYERTFTVEDNGTTTEWQLIALPPTE